MSESTQDPYDEAYQPDDLWPDETPAKNVAVEPSPSQSLDLWAPPPEPDAAPFVPEAYSPLSVDETNRRSGLAWSAGIAFFASTAFMLFIGWLADLVLGSSPWGLVIGIVLGAAIGFFQFVRITSRIFHSDKNDIRPLLSGHDLKDNDDA